MGGIVIDIILYLAKKKPSESRLVATIIGLLYNIPDDIASYWSFATFLGWAFPLIFFLYGFIMIHMILGAVGGAVSPNIILKIRPLLCQT
jgi:hypothetical protein